MSAHRPIRRRGRGRDRAALIEALVWPPLVVVRDVLGEDPSQVALADNQHLVEAFLAGRADPALGVGVRHRRAAGRAHDLGPLGREDRVEGWRELRVAVVDEEAEGTAVLLEGPGEVARLLRDPGAGRVRGAAGEMRAARADLDEEEYLQRPEERRLDGEEVARQQGVAMPGQERPPGAAPLRTLRRGRHGVPPENRADRRAPDGVAELDQLAVDPGVPPARVLARKPDDERRERRVGGPSPGAATAPEGPVLATALIRTRFLAVSIIECQELRPDEHGSQRSPANRRLRASRRARCQARPGDCPSPPSRSPRPRAVAAAAPAGPRSPGRGGAPGSRPRARGTARAGR
jgi:hypothetical protein